MEDSESLALNLCLVLESGTLTFPVDISVTSTAISATGMGKYSRCNIESGRKARSVFIASTL